MRLYDMKHAPNPRRVRIFLAEKGVEIPRVEVDLGALDNRQPDFLARNPLGKIPVLELDDGRFLCETVAICRLVESLHPDPPLMGVDDVDRAFVEMWSRRAEIELYLHISACFRHTHEFFTGKLPQVPEFGELSRRIALERMLWYDAELASREFLAGERFTIADITALVGIDFGRLVDIHIDPSLKNLQRWHEAVSSRPSAAA